MDLEIHRRKKGKSVCVKAGGMILEDGGSMMEMRVVDCI
jgi:hypothetical protein